MKHTYQIHFTIGLDVVPNQEVQVESVKARSLTKAILRWKKKHKNDRMLPIFID